MITPPEASEPSSNGRRRTASGSSSNGQMHDPERRRRPRPSDPDEYLRELPASVLLDRLPVPMLAIGLDGVVVYHNPAFSKMLGHGPDVTLVGYGLPALLDVHAATTRSDCVETLRAAGRAPVDWLHAEGFPVRSMISETLLFRTGDEVMLVGVTDITEMIWATRAEPRWGT